MPKNVPAFAWGQGIRAAIDVGAVRTSGEGFCVFQLSVFVHLAEVVLRLNIAPLGKLDAISSMPW
jgi:hypothetical protein